MSSNECIGDRGITTVAEHQGRRSQYLVHEKWTSGIYHRIKGVAEYNEMAQIYRSSSMSDTKKENRGYMVETERG